MAISTITVSPIKSSEFSDQGLKDTHMLTPLSLHNLLT